jgi:type I restriction enzyme, S subunit
MIEWPLMSIRSIVKEKETWNARWDERALVEYLEISGIDNSSGRVIRTKKIPTSNPPSRAKRLIRAGDIVFGTTRPYLKNIAVIPEWLDNQVCSTGFCVLRAQPHKVLTEWLFAICRSDLVVDQVIPGQEKHAYPAVSDDAILDSLIPLPDVNEQRRIVARVEALTRRAEEARKLRQEAADQIATQFFHVRRKIYQSLLLDFPTKSLGKCGKVMGGGTPSKQQADYWDGDIPWVSAKDMKTFFLSDSKLKITTRGLSESSAKLISKNSVLFVVRGSILYRYVPIAVNTMPCTINQDLKAIVPDKGINSYFLAHMLWAANDILLGMVEEAGNTAGKLPSESWAGLDIPIPDEKKQEAIVQELTSFQEKLVELESIQSEIAQELEQFQSSLLAKAFRGEL